MSALFEGEFSLEFYPPGSVSSGSVSNRVSELAPAVIEEPTDEEDLRTPRLSQVIEYQEQRLVYRADAASQTEPQTAAVIEILQLLKPNCQEWPHPVAQLQTEVKLLVKKLHSLESENSRLKESKRCSPALRQQLFKETHRRPPQTPKQLSRQLEAAPLALQKRSPPKRRLA